MKFIRSFYVTVLIVLASSCNLDLLEDPNEVKLSATDPSLLLNQIQINLAGFFNTASQFGMQVTRLQNSGGAVYENFANPNSFDGMWLNGYANILTDCDLLIKQADASNFSVHAGMARVMQAYTLSVLVDYFGNVPFSQAFLGSSNFNPTADTPADLYTAIIAILDKSILDLRRPPSAAAPVISDFYYGGTTIRWIRLANSLKLKMNLNLSNVDAPSAKTGIEAASVDAAGFMSAQGDSFLFRYGTNIADPDVRHPNFTGNYITGAGDYMSNYHIWQMYYGYDIIDPRIRFFFYRQRGVNSVDPNELRCVAQVAPPHYPFSTGTVIVYAPAVDPTRIPPGISTDPNNPAWRRAFCQPTPVGYWGREHIDPQGIPPDGLARTTWGAYPAGGRFDANVNTGANNPNLGMRGAGMQPILMRSSVSFMLAEAVLDIPGIILPNTAAVYFDAGVNASLIDVRDWAINGTLGTSALAASPNEAVTINAFFPTVGTVLTPVRVATASDLFPTSNIALTGLQTIDGVLLAPGDRVLVKDQTAAGANGIYVANAAAWTRATDADTQAELLGATVTATAGTTNATTRYVQITTGTITVGTTALNWRSPLTDEITRYRARANAAYAAQTSTPDRINIMAREYWVSLFGSGVEAYNLYRRTGAPYGMQPTVNPSPGAFPRTFWYPNNLANRNSSVPQKANLTGKLFWDNSSSGLDF